MQDLHLHLPLLLRRRTLLLWTSLGTLFGEDWHRRRFLFRRLSIIRLILLLLFIVCLLEIEDSSGRKILFSYSLGLVLRFLEQTWRIQLTVLFTLQL